MPINQKKYKLVVIGGSAGSLESILAVIANFQHLPVAVIIIVHRKDDADNLLVDLLAGRTKHRVKEAEDKEQIMTGTIYIAPPDYHLLIEKGHSFSLDISEKVNYSRPSIDVCFQTAAEAYREELVCVLLSGANADGAAGIKKAGEYGGLTVVQDPLSAEVAYMPERALLITNVNHIIGGKDLPAFINKLIEAGD